MKTVDFIRNFFAVGCTCMAFIAGCAGFTDDSNTTGMGDEDNSLEDAFAMSRVVKKGKVLVNASQDSITFVSEIFGGCFKRDGSIYYDPDYYFADTNHYAYSFRNDTLQLSFIYEDQTTKELETVQYVGGASGELDGTWRLTPCFYIDGVYYCNNDAYDKFIKLDGNDVEFRSGDVANYDYMNSDFVGDVFRFLNGNNTIMFEDVFYSRTNNSPEKYGITVQEKTNKSIKFTHEGRVFDLKLDYVRYSDSVAVRLTSNGTTCVGHYSKKNHVTPELCREENAPYLDFLAKDSDSDAHALRYKKDNISEFEKCINSIIGRE